jgi:membrane-bound lytic murein transglycosylase B
MGKYLKIKHNKIMQTLKLIRFGLVGLCFLSCPVWSAENISLSAWMRAFKAEAIASDISAITIKNTFKSAKYLPQVIKLDRAQPEFITPFLNYVDKRVNASTVARGKNLIQENDVLLTQIENQYGVPKQILIAFWGVETGYGSNKGQFGLPSALMTLAYEGRRADFFRGQLLDTMRIVDAGHHHISGMRGSWAGASGHMQFMPSTMLKYGVDADNDGRVNIWTSLPDAFASAANYLSLTGWQKNEIAAIEVKLPATFPYNEAMLTNRKNVTDWVKLGVTDVNGKTLPNLTNAAIVLPQGWQGPAFMVFTNFDVMMDWNRSVNYALSVAHLASQYSGGAAIIGGTDAEKQALTYYQMITLQNKLNALGFDCGKPDGFPGLQTQAAVRQYQATKNLPQDGYASPSLYEKIFSL